MLELLSLLLGSTLNKDQDELLHPQSRNAQELGCHLRSAQVSIEWLVIVL